jgi:hypothetical protein
MLFKYGKFYALLVFSFFCAVADAQGVADGGFVVREGAKIYRSSKGPESNLVNVPLKFAVAGHTTVMLTTVAYNFEEENGRVQVIYLNLDNSGKQTSPLEFGWMDPSDIQQFKYQCGCEKRGETKCSPTVDTGGYFSLSKAWNACFRDGLEKKIQESSAKLTIEASASKTEGALTNQDIISLVKADLGDDLVVSKVKQVPREAFDVSVDALIKLKSDGVSKVIIETMIKRVESRK